MAIRVAFQTASDRAPRWGTGWLRPEPVAGVEVEALDQARRPRPQLGWQRGEDLELGGRDDGPEAELGGRPGQPGQEQRLGLLAGHPGQPRPVAVDQPDAAVDAALGVDRHARRAERLDVAMDGPFGDLELARRARRRSAGRAPGGAAAATRDGRRARPPRYAYSCQKMSCSAASCGRPRGSDRAVERVAGGRVAALVAGREPLLALVGRAVRPRVGVRPGRCVASWIRSSPTAAAASSASAIWASVNGSRNPVLAAWFAQTPGEAVGLELRPDRLALGTRLPPPPLAASPSRSWTWWPYSWAST